MALRQKVTMMRAKAISLVGQGAEKNSAFFMLQSADGTKALIQRYVDQMQAATEPSQRLRMIDNLALQLKLTNGPSLTQGVTEEQNELIAKSGGWLTWQAFQEYLTEQVTSPEEAIAAVDEFAALLKTMLTLPGDNDGDEAPWQKNSATTGSTQSELNEARYASMYQTIPPKEVPVTLDPNAQPTPAQTAPVAPVAQAVPDWSNLDITGTPPVDASGTPVTQGAEPVLPESAQLNALAAAITQALLSTGYPIAGQPTPAAPNSQIVPAAPVPQAVPVVAPAPVTQTAAAAPAPVPGAAPVVTVTTPVPVPAVAQAVPADIAPSATVLQPVDGLSIESIRQAITDAIAPLQAEVNALKPMAIQGVSRQPDQEVVDALKQRIADKGIWSVGPLAPLHNN